MSASSAALPSPGARPLATRHLKLFSAEGRFQKELELPFHQEPPEVIVWASRTFRRALSGGYHYTEVSCWQAPAESEARS